MCGNSLNARNEFITQIEKIRIGFLKIMQYMQDPINFDKQKLQETMEQVGSINFMRFIVDPN